jgi:hypothetical protein
MFRVLGQISIYGTKASIDRCASVAQIPNGTIKQIGLKAKIPPLDEWLYASPLYRFRFDHLDTMDHEIRDFLAAHLKVSDALASRDTEIEYALFTLCPVEQSYEESFAGILSRETLKMLVDMGLDLEISPEAIMPDAAYWKS